MSLRDALYLSLKNLGLRPARTALSVLGLCIGVAAVITVVAVGSGARRAVTQRIARLGSNLLFVAPAPDPAAATLTLADPPWIDRALAISGLPKPAAIVPVVQSGGPVAVGTTTYPTPLEGVNQDFPQVRADPVAQGRFFDAADVTQARKVADLGATVAAELFPYGSALGHTIAVDGQRLTVVGVMQPLGHSFGVDLDNVVLMPVTTEQQLVGTDQVSMLMVQAPSAAEAPLMQAAIDRLYAARYDSTEAVTVSSQDALLQTVSRTRATLTALLGGTAAISLLVGGIGVMNLMLITVAERTREIGVMRAVGASRDDVAALFLLEAVWLSAVGGLLGVGLGVAGAWAVPRVLHTPASVSWTAIAVGFVFSLLIGVVFGFWPARRAAALAPLEALRRE